MNSDLETMAISEFKAKCLGVISRVHRTGKAVVVTKRGEPIATIAPPPSAPLSSSWLGCLRHRARITGDVIAPASDPSDWEALG
jgi:prevent-host-death family protein